MRGRAAIFPIAFAVIFGVANGIAIFKPLVIEQRLKTIREQNGIVDPAADETLPSDGQKKSPVHLEIKQMKETKATGVSDSTLNMRDEGEVKPMQAKILARSFLRKPCQNTLLAQ